MVGGGPGAFIGAVHRMAIGLDERADLTAGCFSSKEDKNLQCGEKYGLAKDRIYASYKVMAAEEAKREDKIDFVVVTTPNNTHYEICKVFIENGINVFCEKPLCFTVEQALDLEKLAKEKDVLFGVAYTYPGYAMVKFAKELIAAGEIGEIINVNAEYLQDWMIDDIGDGGNETVKLSVWRSNPEIAGGSNCVGDIGSHIENTVSYMTGLKVKRIRSIFDRYGLALDVNANMLVEFDNGCHGVFCCSQVCAGHYNGLAVRIFGTKGAIEWVQEEPNTLKVTPKGEPIKIYNRATGCVTGRAAVVNHIPSGHPEGLVFAMTNNYKSFIDAVIAKKSGSDDYVSDYSTIEAGVRGVKFINAAIESDSKDSEWVELF
jgi:predicted dehydrogenase